MTKQPKYRGEYYRYSVIAGDLQLQHYPVIAKKGGRITLGCTTSNWTKSYAENRMAELGFATTIDEAKALFLKPHQSGLERAESVARDWATRIEMYRKELSEAEAQLATHDGSLWS